MPRLVKSGIMICDDIPLESIKICGNFGDQIQIKQDRIQASKVLVIVRIHSDHRNIWTDIQVRRQAQLAEFNLFNTV